MANYQYVSYSPVFQHGNNLWQIHATKSGIYTHQMKSILDQLEAVLTHYSQVLVLRFDIRVHCYSDDNKVITDVFAGLLRFIKSAYKIKHVGYHWVREQEKSKQQHYHCVLILDANKIRYPHKLNEFIIEMGNTHNIAPWIPENCFYRFKRNQTDIKQGAIWRISYLAKARGKGYKPMQTKNHGSSRVRLKGS